MKTPLRLKFIDTSGARFMDGLYLKNVRLERGINLKRAAARRIEIDSAILGPTGEPSASLQPETRLDLHAARVQEDLFLRCLKTSPYSSLDLAEVRVDGRFSLDCPRSGSVLYPPEILLNNSVLARKDNLLATPFLSIELKRAQIGRLRLELFAIKIAPSVLAEEARFEGPFLLRHTRTKQDSSAETITADAKGIEFSNAVFKGPVRVGPLIFTKSRIGFSSARFDGETRFQAVIADAIDFSEAQFRAPLRLFSVKLMDRSNACRAALSFAAASAEAAVELRELELPAGSLIGFQHFVFPTGRLDARWKDLEPHIFAKRTRSDDCGSYDTRSDIVPSEVQEDNAVIVGRLLANYRERRDTADGNEADRVVRLLEDGRNLSFWLWGYGYQPFLPVFWGLALFSLVAGLLAWCRLFQMGAAPPAPASAAAGLIWVPVRSRKSDDGALDATCDDDRRSSALHVATGIMLPHGLAHAILQFQLRKGLLVDGGIRLTFARAVCLLLRITTLSLLGLLLVAIANTIPVLRTIVQVVAGV